LRCGRPQRLIEALRASGKKNLTIISNDTGFGGEGIGALISSGQVARCLLAYRHQRRYAKGPDRKDDAG
jgi:acyl CoA:acetate/3-ketoacid CoA transferase alpha subunit